MLRTFKKEKNRCLRGFFEDIRAIFHYKNGLKFRPELTKLPKNIPLLCNLSNFRWIWWLKNVKTFKKTRLFWKIKCKFSKQKIPQIEDKIDQIPKISSFLAVFEKKSMDLVTSKSNNVRRGKNRCLAGVLKEINAVFVKKKKPPIHTDIDKFFKFSTIFEQLFFIAFAMLRGWKRWKRSTWKQFAVKWTIVTR